MMYMNIPTDTWDSRAWLYMDYMSYIKYIHTHICIYIYIYCILYGSYGLSRHLDIQWHTHIYIYKNIVHIYNHTYNIYICIWYSTATDGEQMTSPDSRHAWKDVLCNILIPLVSWVVQRQDNYVQLTPEIRCCIYIYILSSVTFWTMFLLTITVCLGSAILHFGTTHWFIVDRILIYIDWIRVSSACRWTPSFPPFRNDQTPRDSHRFSSDLARQMNNGSTYAGWKNWCNLKPDSYEQPNRYHYFLGVLAILLKSSNIRLP